MTDATCKAIKNNRGLDDMILKIPLWLKVIEWLSFCFHLTLHNSRETKQTKVEKIKELSTKQQRSLWGPQAVRAHAL